jgi:SAM-dependent methyltransferase
MVQRKPVSPDVYTDEYYLGCSSGHDRFEESRGLYVPPLIFSIVEHADIQAGQRVLDLGCGRGEVAFNLAALGASAIGLDYASSALKLATAMREEHPDLAERVALAKGDAKQLPFRSSSFDAAFMLDVVEHLQPWELHLALVEVRRLLKPSGALYIHTMPNLRFYRYVNEQTPRSLRGALNEAGFDSRVWVSDYVRPVLKPGTLHRLASGVGKRRPLRAIAAFNVFAEARPR